MSFKFQYKTYDDIEKKNIDHLKSAGYDNFSSLLLKALPWRHDECNGVSNHRRLDCLSNRLFRRRSKKTSKLRVTGICDGNSPVTLEFPHKWLVTRKVFPFDHVIMDIKCIISRQLSIIINQYLCLVYFQPNLNLLNKNNPIIQKRSTKSICE